MNREIVRRVRTAVFFRSGNDAIGGESTWCEEIGVNASVWVLRGRINLGEATGVGYDGGEGMTFCGIFVNGRMCFTGWSDIVAFSRNVAENINLCES